MHKKTILTGYTSIFLLLAILGALSIMPVRVAKAWTVDDDGPADFSTIQAAINAAGDGDTIQVASGIYYERVIVNKSLTLEGDGSSTTIIDGNGNGTVVEINAPDVKITGFTVQNGGDFPNSGMFLRNCFGNRIYNNRIRKNVFGIRLRESNSCIIVNNLIVNNSVGVWITSGLSRFNTFYHNNFIDNLDHAQSAGAWTTKWDNGAEGNHWSGYTGKDLDRDGIGDTAYVTGENVDYYPLMEPWSPYRVFDYNVTTFSNSTLACFDFNQTLEQIRFNATSGASGFCYITIPKTLLNVTNLDDWTVIIDGINASRTVTDNATHTTLYFTYSKGVHQIVITTRILLSSTISMNLSSTNITLGESVTISGKVTPADNTTRADAPVTIYLYNTSRLPARWDTFATVTTNQSSQYSYTWTQNKTGTYEVKARWNGDVYTLGDESDTKILTVLGTPVRRWSFEVTVEGEVFEVVIKSNFTVSGFAFNDSLNEIYFNVDGMAGNTYVCNITIPKEVLWCDDLGDWVVWIDNVKASVEIDKNETHTFIYLEYIASVHNVRIGTKISSISIALSEDSITLGSSVTINGTIIPLRTNVNVMILCRLTDGNWTTLANMTTNEHGVYSYDWTPDEAGTYEVKANWPGNEETNPAQSEAKTITVEEEEAEGIPLETVIIIVVVVIMIAAVVIYFVKVRKP